MTSFPNYKSEPLYSKVGSDFSHTFNLKKAIPTLKKKTLMAQFQIHLYQMNHRKRVPLCQKTGLWVICI